MSSPDRVEFDSAEALSPEQAIIKVKKKVAENTDSINEVSDRFQNKNRVQNAKCRS